MRLTACGTDRKEGEGGGGGKIKGKEDQQVLTTFYQLPMTMQKRRMLHRGDLARLLTVGTSLPNQVSVELGVHTDLSVIHSADLIGQTEEYSVKAIIHHRLLTKKKKKGKNKNHTKEALDTENSLNMCSLIWPLL